MNRRWNLMLFTLVTSLLASACARHVVIDPAQVRARNQADWTIQSTPKSNAAAPEAKSAETNAGTNAP